MNDAREAEFRLENVYQELADKWIRESGKGEPLSLERFERTLTIQALIRTEGNLTKAGRLMCLNRDQVRYRIKTYDLRPLLKELRENKGKPQAPAINPGSPARPEFPSNTTRVQSLLFF